MKRNSYLHYGVAALVFCALLGGIYAMGASHAEAASVIGATTYYSAQLTRTSDDNPRNYPTEKHGKMYHSYFYYKNETGGTLADGSEIELCHLPAGRVAVLPNLSRYRVTALGASRTLDIGHRIYKKADDPAAPTQADDDDAFVADKDVSGAVTDVAFDGGASNMHAHMFSKEGITVYATVDGGTIPANAIIEGFVTYVYGG